MKLSILILMFCSIVFAGGTPDCPVCPAKPKRRVSPVRKAVPVKREPQQRQEQDQENEQEQEQRQTVNVHVHNDSQKNTRTVVKRARFRLGLHAGCGPAGIKRVVFPSFNRYDLENDLVVGGSLSIRLLGPVWLTGQVFSNRMYTGGLELEF